MRKRNIANESATPAASESAVSSTATEEKPTLESLSKKVNNLAGFATDLLNYDERLSRLEKSMLVGRCILSVLLLAATAYYSIYHVAKDNDPVVKSLFPIVFGAGALMSFALFIGQENTVNLIKYLGDKFDFFSNCRNNTRGSAAPIDHTSHSVMPTALRTSQLTT